MASSSSILTWSWLTPAHVNTTPSNSKAHASPRSTPISSAIAVPDASLVSGSHLGCRQQRRRRRGEAVVTRAGPPSNSQLLLAFFLPLSLIVGTVVVSIRVADRLDEKYLEELAMNQAIMEENQAAAASGEKEDDGEEGSALPEEPEVAVASRVRNRPRRRQA